MNERIFTLEELQKCDGKNGRSAYIAYKGKGYDVSGDYLWIGGSHQDMHEAGKDLTKDMALAPHAEEMLERVKLVGMLAP